MKPNIQAPQLPAEPAVRPSSTQVGNRPPRFIRAQTYMDSSEAVRVRPGSTIRLPVLATDEDGDTISYSTKTLPPGAQFDAENQSFSWTPQATDAGLHSVIFTASDASRSDSLLVQFFVTSKDVPPGEPQAEVDPYSSNIESFLQPGVGYGIYVPGDQDSLGVFHGVDLELNIISWIHKNDDRGPSHGRFYIKAEIMPSAKEGVSQLFIYSLGTTLTIERNPNRSWLLPHYGVEFGGLNQEDIGGAFQSTFFAGLHLWASANLFVNLSAGYMLVPEQMKELGGFHGGTSVDFSLW
jgi:Putative Ig domain